MADVFKRIPLKTRAEVVTKIINNKDFCNYSGNYSITIVGSILLVDQVED